MPEPGLSHLVIEAYTKAQMSGSPVKTYTARVNPEKYSKTLQICYSKDGGMGNANAVVKFNRMPPGQMDFELLFDATGAIDGSPTDLTLEIGNFLNTIYRFQGGMHQPYYLKVIWGTESFPARASQIKIDYTLFATTGVPLRARATLSLTNSVDFKTIQKVSGKQSPDITHRIQVRAGETLPAISQRVYGSPSRYPDLARANRLVNFRALRPGTEVICPPFSPDHPAA